MPRLVTFTLIYNVLVDYSGDHKNPSPTTKEFPYIYTVDRIPRASKTCYHYRLVEVFRRRDRLLTRGDQVTYTFENLFCSVFFLKKQVY